MTNAGFYKAQLNRFIAKWHTPAEYFSDTDATLYNIRLHIGKFRQVETIGDIDQRQFKGIISVLDIDQDAGQTPPEDGDKIYYSDQVITVDGVDPRLEVGEIIGYDLTLRGT